MKTEYQCWKEHCSYPTVVGLSDSPDGTLLLSVSEMEGFYHTSFAHLNVEQVQALVRDLNVWLGSKGGIVDYKLITHQEFADVVNQRGVVLVAYSERGNAPKYENELAMMEDGTRLVIRDSAEQTEPRLKEE